MKLLEKKYIVFDRRSKMEWPRFGPFPFQFLRCLEIAMGRLVGLHLLPISTCLKLLMIHISTLSQKAALGGSVESGKRYLLTLIGHGTEASEFCYRKAKYYEVSKACDCYEHLSWE